MSTDDTKQAVPITLEISPTDAPHIRTMVREQLEADEALFDDIINGREPADRLLEVGDRLYAIHSMAAAVAFGQS